MYSHEKEKQKITAQADPQTRNFLTLTSKAQPGSAQTHTSAHTSTRGEGVAKQWAVFVYIYKTPL
jgi:hypothetical protein